MAPTGHSNSPGNARIARWRGVVRNCRTRRNVRRGRTRPMSSRHGRELTPVLLYREVVHGPPTNRWQVSVSALAADLAAVVSSGRSVLPASALADRLSGAGDDEAGLCAVTFDDGNASFVELVLPLLVERGLPAT